MQDARRDADAIVTALEKHKARTGNYPASLVEIGFDPNTMKTKWNLKYERDSAGKPTLFYSAQNMWLEAKHYNFSDSEWFSVN